MLSEALTYRNTTSPLGELLIAANSDGVAGIWFADKPHAPTTNPVITANPRAERWIAQTEQQLQQYFSGKSQQFELSLLSTGTAFQQRVWQALRQIPFGTTLSYQQLANMLGNPRAVRAVGAANGRNPWSIVVPCHRVIGANGALTGYAGGVENKRWLLQWEQKTCEQETCERKNLEKIKSVSM